MSRKLLIVIVLLGVTGVFLLFRNIEPGQTSWLPKCAFYQVTGLHCPGCGATRAVNALANGDVIGAIGFNPMLIVGGPIIAILLWMRRRKTKRGEMVSPTFCWVIFGVLLTWFVARNVPSPKASWFAPGNFINAFDPVDESSMPPHE